MGNSYTDPIAIGVLTVIGGLFIALLKKLNSPDQKYLAFISPLKDKLERKNKK